MFSSKILDEIVASTKQEAPATVKGFNSFVRRTIKNTKAEDWNGLSAEAQKYIMNALTAVKTHQPIPVPEDMIDLGGPRKKKKAQEQSEEFFNLDFFECSSTSKTITVKGLLELKEAGVIRVPDFQRNYVWSNKLQKRFLDGVLRGLGIYSMRLVIDPRTNERNLLDGLQRTETLQRFFNNEITDSQGHRYSSLPDKLKNLFLMTDIHIIESTTDKKFWPEIFQHINTGGAPLTNIEIWRGLFRHDLLARIESVSVDHALWADLYGKAKDKRYKGMYLLLRAVAMDLAYQEYQKPMDRFLVSFLQDLENNPDMLDAQQIHSDLDRILFGLRNHGKAIFRTSKSSQVNIGLLDCTFHAGFEILRVVPGCSATNLEKWLGQVNQHLLRDKEILDAITLDTSGNENTLLRMKRSEELVRQIIEEDLARRK